MQDDYDIVIVGYGPVGQILALLLGQAGCKVAVVERYPALFNMPRAVHFDHEIGRIFQAAGIADEVRAISDGVVEPILFSYLNARREVLRQIKLGGLGPSGWPFANGFAQQELERVIDGAVREQQAADLLLGWECVGITQDSERATVDIRPRGGGAARQLTARYIVGADGANSIVRTMIDPEETDLGFASDWLVVSIRYKSPDTPMLGMMQICDPARSITIAPGGPRRRRLEFMLVGDETAESMSDIAVAWRLLAEFGLNDDLVEIERHSAYRFAARWSHQWRRGRLLIAGDAAHVMPPFRAQGMCSGIRDAAALAWRLPMVLSGAAPDALLDSYGPERIPHVADIIHQSVAIGEVICATDPDAVAQRDAAMVAIAADPSLEPKRSPLPTIGPGVTRDGDPHAGALGFQGRVEVEGTIGLFDDVVGRGFCLIGTTIDPADGLAQVNRNWFESIRGRIVRVTPDGPVCDVDGSYAAFFAAMGVGAMLVRPDFNIFGAVTDGENVDVLVTSLREKLGTTVLAEA